MEEYFKSSVNSSLAHMCGNITSVVFNHIKNKFPNNFFKDQYISTRMALKDFKRIRNNILEMKKQKPVISAIPKIVPELTDFNIDTQKRLFGTNYFDGYDSYQEVLLFKDDIKNQLSFSVERQKMSFEFNYILPTAFSQWNLYGYMMNKMRFDHPYYETVVTEAQIPKVIIKQLSEHTGIPVFDKNGKVTTFLEYINKFSSGKIIYKFKPSTGNYEFFVLIVSNILIECDGKPSLDDGDKEGQTSDDFIISHTVLVEFNYPSVFYYHSFQPHDIINNPESNNNDLLILSQSVLIPMHSLQFDIDEPYEEKEFYMNALFETEKDTDDVTDLKALFDMDFESVINYCKDNKMDLTNLISIRLFKEDKEIEKDKYKFNYEDLNITINGEVGTYRVLIYKSNTVYNYALSSIHELKNEIK